MKSKKHLCRRCGDIINGRDSRAHHCWSCVSDIPKQNDGIRAITKKAVSVGFLPDPKSLNCVDCGNVAICYDHRDYNHPLQVDAVCKSCNAKRGPGIQLNGVLLEKQRKRKAV